MRSVPLSQAQRSRGESCDLLRPMVCSTEASSSASTRRRRSPACSRPRMPMRPRAVRRALVTRFSVQVRSTSGEELGNLVPTGPLARLAGFSDQHDKEIQGVTGGPDHAVRSGADDVAKGGEQLQENGFGLGFGVRGQGAHGLPGGAIERVPVEYVLQG